MTKKVLFSNKMLVLLQKYTKRGKRTHCLLRFPLFGLILCLVSKQSFSGTPVFPVSLTHPLGTLSLPFRGQTNADRFMRKRKARPFPLPACPRGQMTQNLRLPVGYARSIRGERVSSIACSLSLVWGSQTRAIPYAPLRANVLYPRCCSARRACKSACSKMAL